MSDPSSRPADGPSLWSAVREFLHMKGPNTLRASIEEAIEEHAEEGASPGDLDQDERLMLRNMLELAEQKAGDVAVQRSDIIAIPDDHDFARIVSAFREAGHSRLPVYHKSLDEVTGMLHVKDIYTVIADRFGQPAHESAALPAVADLLRPVLFVPPSMPVVDLLTDMRRNRTHMAIVVDEYGGTDGLVTIEDIVEEIVGEIEDEHDDVEQSLIVRHPNGLVEADARVDLDDLERDLGVRFIDDELGDEVDTLGGLSVLMAGRVPEAGERFPHPNGWGIEVTASDGRRVERLMLHPPVAAEAEPEIEG
ncbi:hemolysin family protein [Sandaracinobacter sp. RS1-74]|uniref:hemolysin family protein n=1 Tax=Sandaracinobacteroides sayramensis TaxID=2913411 RepID=UPI001EDB9DDE|nr:hemolysin family protein [Sandaracinobacteroides sayramensis]MCG2840103.1 hemolysin family protein [Sandaracinobacteroides sayramensis]